MSIANTVLRKKIPSLKLNPFNYHRRKTREVKVGSVGVGGNNPIRLQSMTITSTMDTKGTVDQVLKLAAVGCEIARITAPTVRESRNLENIKNELLKKNCPIPLVADIHFSPDAAFEAANWVEKVRINPGNFVDGKAFRVREYTDQQYADEIKKIEDRFSPLVLKLKKCGRALRIGTNHGSLSDRIMNRYGDTPLGMVESALEYTRVCRKLDFHDLIFSMKASNPRVMIAAYRLLAKKLDELGWDYPFHLGVTEAGDGEDGRIKSAVGIGSLLEDGMGDTIRVSLTEDPEYEIPVAKELAHPYSEGVSFSSNESESDPKGPYIDEELSPSRRTTHMIRTGPLTLGGASPIRIFSRFNLGPDKIDDLIDFVEAGVKTDLLPEIIEIPCEGEDFLKKFHQFEYSLKKETDRLALWISFKSGKIPVLKSLGADGWIYEFNGQFNKPELDSLIRQAHEMKIPVLLRSSSVGLLGEALESAEDPSGLLVGLNSNEPYGSLHQVRRLISNLKSKNLDVPVVLFWKSDSIQFKNGC